MTPRKDLARPVRARAQAAQEGRRREGGRQRQEGRQGQGQEGGGQGVVIDLDGLTERVVVPSPKGATSRVLGIPGKVLFTALPSRAAPTGASTPQRHRPRRRSESTTSKAARRRSSRTRQRLRPLARQHDARHPPGSPCGDGRRRRWTRARTRGLRAQERPGGPRARQGQPRPRPRVAPDVRRRLAAPAGLSGTRRSRALTGWRSTAATSRSLTASPRCSSSPTSSGRCRRARHEPRLRHRRRLRASRATTRGTWGGMGGTTREGLAPDPILAGDCWDRDADSPLRAPGANVKVGDVLVVDGRPLDAATTPATPRPQGGRRGPPGRRAEAGEPAHRDGQDPARRRPARFTAAGSRPTAGR